MGQPIRGTTRPLPVKAGIIPAVIPPEVITLNADYKASIHNRFDVEVIDALTGKVKQRAKAENVICQGLYNNLASNVQYFQTIVYGSGLGTPASTDTALFHLEGSISLPTGSNMTAMVNVDWANHVFSCRRMGVINEQTANGITLTELGIMGNALCTHALMHDMNGNPISILKTDQDIINIYATIFVHWGSNLEAQGIHMQPETNWCGFFGYLVGMIDTYNEKANCLISAMPATKPLLTKANSGVSTSGLTKAWSNNNKTLTLSMTRFGASSFNIAYGIRYIIMYSNSFSYGTIPLYPGMTLKAGYPWFAGSNVSGEAIGTGDGTVKDFATKFDNPSAAQIYVDGVLSDNVAVDDAPLNYNNMDTYFEGVQVVNNVVYPYTPSDSSAYTFAGVGSGIFYNPFYANGIKTGIINAGYCVDVSDDCINWTTIWGSHDRVQNSSSTSGTMTVPTEYQNSKYWRSYMPGGYRITNMTARDLTGKNIHFTTAPVSGAVITADYHTPTIAKDTNHVFDLTVTIQLGEYAE